MVVRLLLAALLLALVSCGSSEPKKIPPIEGRLPPKPEPPKK